MDFQLWHGCCLEEMKKIKDNSIDMILTDPPYGTTACKWDTVIPFEPMWEQLKRVTKDNGAICLFGQNPFTANLIMGNPKDYKYCWIWDKAKASNFPNAKKMPLKITENISVFNVKKYFPQMVEGVNRVKGGYQSKNELAINTSGTPRKVNNLYYPKNILKFSVAGNKDTGKHPTQKPVELLEYLIKTYTLENETVLDFTMGSGSAGVACKNLNRNFIGIEKEEKYFKIAQERINMT